MGINKEAYDSILKEYNDRRMANARIRDAKRAEISAALPAFDELEARLAGARVELTKRRISGNKEGADLLKEEISALKKEKENLLLSAGYSLADLEPVYTCPKCKDTGVCGEETCSCFKERLIDVLYENSHIRKILEAENFRSYTFKYYSPEAEAHELKSPLEAAKGAVTDAQAFIRDFASSDTNLYIYGTTGVGKTFLTNCIAKEIIDKGYSVIYISAVRLFEMLADSAFRGRNGSDSLRPKYIYDCDLLIIDDLGTEIANAFTQSALFDCINERLLKGKHTVISSNLSIEKLRTNYTERIFSRITSSYKMIKLLGKDIRMLKKLED